MATVKRYETFEELKQSEIVKETSPKGVDNQVVFKQFGKLLREAMLKKQRIQKQNGRISRSNPD